ncbi:MAG: hypothetical protein ABIH08_04110 [Candidatus Omnitrophota bacterium]
MNKQNKILDYFSLLKNRGLIGTSYLFIGEDSSLVNDIVRLINCPESLDFCNACWDCKMIAKANHPDLLIIEPEKLITKIEAAREGIKFLCLKSFRLKRKALIIKDASSLSPAAASAFLKTLEEPPKNSFLAVCAPKLEGILPTIISRCRKIFLPFKEQGFEYAISSNRIHEFLGAKTIVFKDRKEFRSFLWAFIELLRGNLLCKTGYQNDCLPYGEEYEIILKPFGISQIGVILKDILRIYEAHNSINMNLALSLIRMRIK